MNDFESWKNAECPEGMDEATFNHVWFGYGIKHNYLIFDTKSKGISIKQDRKFSSLNAPEGVWMKKRK